MPSATFSSASANISTFRQITTSVSNQILRMTATTSGSSGVATGWLLLVRANTVLTGQSFTITPTARRTAADNGSGNYIGTVVFSESGKSVADLLGHAKPAGGTEPGPGFGGEDRGAVWMVGITALGGHSSIVLDWDSSDQT